MSKVADKARAAAGSEEEKNRISACHDRLIHELSDTRRQHSRERVKAYQAQGLQIAQHTFDATAKPSKDGKSALDAFNEHFMNAVAKPYLEDLSRKLTLDDANLEGLAGAPSLDLGDRDGEYKALEAKLKEVRENLSGNAPKGLPSEKEIKEHLMKHGLRF
ncbi:hypothetical protein AF335_18545 [Streptomyces eurocidicus]|uniref:Uncharacterized protein n=1 Tax=Streptomyces eurocidicus TaxID=66423 RepID=A0A2N8NUW2_STREU|nr:hypothetical protein [Streptomyces eurocidicus]MBB5121224.1 hypothetical protein [Streptomyces eurocidicus]MBF6055833.1 hypothetical protein [Streptomyces eurocidicus]PNE32553.1 hypothetical protein AF335_18545 [Streptomyces eurocidicus]